MSEKYWRDLRPIIRDLRFEWRYIEEELRRHFRLERDRNYSEEIDEDYSPELLNFLKRLSMIFARCPIKAILIPGFNYENKISQFMVEEDILKRIVDIHPGDTVLILQLEDILEKRDIALLNVFPKFEQALIDIEKWPGVFLWNDNEAEFFPIESKDQLFDIFYVLKYENGSFDYLRRKFYKPKKNYAYLFHLSDLHFGNKIAERNLVRIIRLLENQLAEFDSDSLAIPIITGDMLDSPTKTNHQTYNSFTELLRTKGFEDQIQILGNHDVDTSGIVKRLTSQKTVITSLAQGNNIVLFEDLKLGIIKFNSNSGGSLAQGQIGTDQLMDIGNEIDAIKNRNEFTFIVILHHHPIEIENPEWYSRDWYEALIGRNNFDKTMKLVDSELFLDWVQTRGIKYILHGHKHIPKIQKHKDITIIAAGSSSGSVRHKEKGKTYLTYNLIKYDIDKKTPVSCSIIVEEILGAGAKNMLMHLM